MLARPRMKHTQAPADLARPVAAPRTHRLPRRTTRGRQPCLCCSGAAHLWGTRPTRREAGGGISVASPGRVATAARPAVVANFAQWHWPKTASPSLMHAGRRSTAPKKPSIHTLRPAPRGARRDAGRAHNTALCTASWTTSSQWNGGHRPPYSSRATAHCHRAQNGHAGTAPAGTLRRH